MDKSLVIAIIFLVFCILYLLYSSEVKDFLTKIIFLAVVALTYFGSQHFFGQNGKAITVIILIGYGVIAWKVKKVGSIVLWPIEKK